MSSIANIIQLILLITCVFIYSVSFAQNAPTPGKHNRNDNDPFYGNPNEDPTDLDNLEEEEELELEKVPNTGANTTDLPQDEVVDSVINPRIFSDAFNTALPAVFSEGEWHLRLNPKFGDFFGDDYIRTGIGTSYYFSNYFEGFVELQTYFPNPLEGESRVGLSEMEIGTKYSWWNIGASKYNVSLAIRARMPLSNPPVEINDGYARYEPSISVSRKTGNDPATMAYLNIAYEFVERSPFKASPISPIPRDRIFIRPGYIYYPGGHFRYAAELEYRTNVFGRQRTNKTDYNDYIGTREYTMAFKETHEFFISPTVTWFPTEEIRKGLFIPGNWDVSFRLKIPIVEETDQSLGASIRFRWYYDYEQVLTDKLNSLRFWNNDGE